MHVDSHCDYLIAIQNAYKIASEQEYDEHVTKDDGHFLVINPYETDKELEEKFKKGELGNLDKDGKPVLERLKPVSNMNKWNDNLMHGEAAFERASYAT